jgi:hypothetical protein
VFSTRSPLEELGGRMFLGCPLESIALPVGKLSDGALHQRRTVA